MGDSDKNASTWRRTLQSLLTKASHGSAPFITTFVLIHLSAPALANLGGSSLASQVMILGREYYQTPFGEKYLLLAPLIFHPVSSTLKRVLAPKPARRLTSILSITGYVASVSTVIHFFAHRYYPSLAEPPIYAVGPAELDYEYVKLALHEWPWRSWIGYIALTTCVAWHAAEGSTVIWNRWLRGAFGSWKGSAKSNCVKAAALVLPVVTGLWVLSREPLMALTSTTTRFRAALTESPLYSFQTDLLVCSILDESMNVIVRS